MVQPTVPIDAPQEQIPCSARIQRPGRRISGIKKIRHYREYLCIFCLFFFWDDMFDDTFPFCSQRLDGKITFDFKNQDGLRLLTTILLKKDFNLEVHLPVGKLIPTIPLRLNYLLWIEDLFNLNYDSTKKIKGIDIGIKHNETSVFSVTYSRIIYQLRLNKNIFI